MCGAPALCQRKWIFLPPPHSWFWANGSDPLHTCSLKQMFKLLNSWNSFQIQCHCFHRKSWTLNCSPLHNLFISPHWFLCLLASDVFSSWNWVVVTSDPSWVEALWLVQLRCVQVQHRSAVVAPRVGVFIGKMGDVWENTTLRLGCSWSAATTETK